jgi:GNAT superfamily N-acetyltransferase
MTDVALRIAPAATDAEIAACFPVMQQLRPPLADAASFTAQVHRQAAHGYRLLALWRGDQVVACAGYRVSENLIRGRHLYVDDLVAIADERSRGHGDRLFDALLAEARRQDCRWFLLDSGLDNGPAHRFYFRRRMTVAAFRFALPLD